VQTPPSRNRLVAQRSKRMLSVSTLSLKGRALRALAAREHSRAELERKLASFESEPGELAKILDELTAKDFISEQRVADSLAYRRGSKLGTARVVQELKAKGVEAGVVQQAAAALKATELERAREVWRKKFGSAAPESAALAGAQRLKHMRFLASRGFAPEVIRRVVGGDGEA
jgi:regulatory protein